MRDMFFGTLYDTLIPGTSSTTSNARMSMVPLPDPDFDAGSSGYSTLLQFENGGADVVSAAATHRNYNFAYSTREASGASGLDIIHNYERKLYGPGLIYFANPMTFAENMLSPSWSAPGLIEMGWKNIFSSTPTFSNVATNAYSHPNRKATWPVAVTINSVPTGPNQIEVIPIRPDHTLWLGFGGTATGTAGIKVRPINHDGSYAAISSVTFLIETSSNRMNLSFSGATYKAVEIYITRTSTADSTITITSGMAQQWPTGFTPTTTGPWIMGQGNTGCKFASDAIVETYTILDLQGQRHLKGMSTSLTEVGAWQRQGM